MKTHNNIDALPHPWFTSLSLIAGILCLLIANGALWFNHNIFNTQNFTAVATPALTDDLSREAMAAQITEKLLQDHPVLKKVANDPLEKMIAGLLHSDVAKTVIGKSVVKLHTYVTSPNPQTVAIDLSNIKDKLGSVFAIAGQISGQATTTENLTESINNVPEKIVLLEPEQLPNIYKIGSTLEWVGPFALILGIILLFLPLFFARRGKRVFAKILLCEAVCFVAGGTLGIMMGQAIKPTVLAKVENSNARLIVENLYNAFIASFNRQTMWILIFGIFLALLSLLFYLFSRPRLKN